MSRSSDTRPDAEPTAAGAARARILIVDDLPEKRLAYGAILEGMDAEVVMAGSGEEALKRVLEGEFAVILLDVNMPGMDGLETAGASAPTPQRAAYAHHPGDCVRR